MFAAAELSHWLDDAAKIEATLERVKAFKCDPDYPVFPDLAAALDRLDSPSAEEVSALALRHMQGSQEVVRAIQRLGTAAKEDPFFQPPYSQIKRDIHNGLVLLDHPLVLIAAGAMSVEALAAKKVAGRESSITFPGHHTVFRFVKAGDATLSFWRAPDPGGPFRASESGRCALIERRRLADGDAVLVTPGRETFVIEHATSDLVYLQAVIRVGGVPIVLEYDSNSLDFVGATSGDESASRIQMMASLLRLMNREDAAPLLVELLDSPHFFTRWHLMRELLALDADAALAPLKAMAENDPHPEVRTAAAQTLRSFFEEDAACPA